MIVTKITVDAFQNEKSDGTEFGYVMSEEGGYFFSYVNGRDTDIETLIGSLDADTCDKPDFEESEAAAMLRKWDVGGRPRHMTVPSIR